MLKVYDIYNDFVKSNNIFFNTPIKNCDETECSTYDINTDDLFLYTDDTFYCNGILENIINQINKTKSINHNEIFDSDVILNHNWLLGYHILNYINSINILPIENFNILLLGKNDINIISSIYYWYKNNDKIINIDWCVFTDDKNIKKNTSKIIKNIDNDIFTYNNIANSKSYIEKNIKNINLIFNNFKPDEKNILLSLLYSILYLNDMGICINKINAPFLWNKLYNSYLTLYSVFFYNVKIIKFPICKNKKIFYNYYLIGFNKKKLINMNVIYDKLLIYIINNCKQTFNFEKISDIQNKHVENINWEYELKLINKNDLYELIENLL